MRVLYLTRGHPVRDIRFAEAIAELGHEPVVQVVAGDDVGQVAQSGCVCSAGCRSCRPSPAAVMVNGSGRRSPARFNVLGI